MSQFNVQELLEKLRNGEMSRRAFMRQSIAAGVSATAAGMLARTALADEATPAVSPDATGEVFTSITRAKFYAQLKSTFEVEEAQVTGDQLVVSYSQDVGTLNPILRTDVYSGFITELVYEGLVGTSPIDGSVVPSGIADSWEIAGDGVTYTFHLNPNATWHDGEPVTADDVVFTFDAVLAENSPSVRKATVEQFLASYQKVDDHTVELVSITPSAVFLDKTALLFEILPMHVWESVPVVEWPSDEGSTGQDPTRVVGSGPFRFVEWQIGDHLTLQRNDEYWDTENIPYIDQYIFDVQGEDTTIISSLKAGETDVCEISSTFIDSVRNDRPDIQTVEADTAKFTFYSLNQDPARTDLFQDVRVRQALMYALDRDVYADAIMNGFAIRASGSQPVLSPAYAPDRMNTDFIFDPEKAKALMEEAGWVDTGGDGIREKDGKKFSFECIYDEGEVTYTQGIPFLQQHWRDIGVDMRPSATPFTIILDHINTGSFDSVLIGFSWNFDGMQGDMFRCSATMPNGFNMMSYCNQEYDDLDAAARSELDADKRRELLIEAANIVNDEQAVGVLVFRKDIYGANPRVHNFMPQGYSGYWWVRYAWLAEG